MLMMFPIILSVVCVCSIARQIAKDIDIDVA